MSTALYFLEKISTATGELALYKESGVLAVVEIEKITVEPDLVTFTLKPQRGSSFGLDNLKAFSVSSSFNYLSYDHGRYMCSIISWVLETDPVKVIYLKNLINLGASTEDILTALRKRHVFYDNETTKIVDRLMKLKNKIKKGKISLTSDPEFKGQSWGGAGVMVLSNDKETKKHFSHFQGDTIVSDYAPQIGDLFRRISRISATSPNYDYFSKVAFWGNLAAVANSLKQNNNSENLQEICNKVIMKAIDFVTQNPSEN